MTEFLFNGSAERRHRGRRNGAATLVDDVPVRARPAEAGAFVVDVGDRPVRMFAVADGDTVHVHINGRAVRVERLDPARSGGGKGAPGQDGLQAPMPGVVVSCVAAAGSRVAKGEALLVIESMKLQMTIEAPHAGLLADLPFAVGQTFQRGAVLARIEARTEELAA
jgi:3-methylcrotonyl-CoA carboxylase alpha subunit